MGCYICQDATQIVQEDPFLCNCFIVPEAPRLFRGAEPEAYFQPPKGILDRVLRKRYTRSPDGDGVWDLFLSSSPSAETDQRFLRFMSRTASIETVNRGKRPYVHPISKVIDPNFLEFFLFRGCLFWLSNEVYMEGMFWWFSRTYLFHIRGRTHRAKQLTYKGTYMINDCGGKKQLLPCFYLKATGIIQISQRIS